MYIYYDHFVFYVAFHSMMKYKNITAILPPISLRGIYNSYMRCSIIPLHTIDPVVHNLRLLYICIPYLHLNPIINALSSISPSQQSPNSQ